MRWLGYDHATADVDERHAHPTVARLAGRKWTATTFHAPYQTTVESRVENGKLQNYR